MYICKQTGNTGDITVSGCFLQKGAQVLEFNDGQMAPADVTTKQGTVHCQQHAMSTC